VSQKNKKYYSQDIILESRIDGPIITLKDGRYMTLVEIRPVNFTGMDDSAQQLLVSSIHSWYKICPKKFQLKIITISADAKEHVEKVRKDLSHESNQKIVQVGLSYCNFVSEQSRMHALQKRFIFCFTDDAIEGRRLTEEGYQSELLTVAMQCRQYFASCGHKVVTYESREKQEEAMKELLYRFYNPKSYEYDTLQIRKTKVTEDYLKWNPEMDKKNVPLDSIIAPRNIEFKHRDYVVIDGTYRSYYYIPADDYPVNIPAGWVGSIPLLDGMHLDMFVERSQSHNDIALRQNIARKELITNKEGGTTERTFRIMQQSTKYLQQAIENGEEIFYVSTIITIEAKTIKSLQEKEKFIHSYFKSRGLDLITCRYEQERAFMSTLFRNRIQDSLKRKANQNITSVSLAAMYPITAFEMADPDGIFLGLNATNNSPVTYDPFDTSAHENANILIMGGSGKGKSMTLQLLALRLRLRNIPVFVIAPVKAIEFAPIVNMCKGTYVTISDASPDCINIMEIRPPNKDNEILLTGGIGSNYSLLAQKIDDLEIMLDMIYPSASESIMQTFNNCCMATYEKYGITQDNDSLYHDPTDRTTLKEMPILGDLVKEIETVAERDPSVNDLAIVMSRFTTGSSRRFNGRTNVDLTTKMVVIDVEHLSEKLKPFGMFIATSVVRSYIEEDRTARKMLMIDEAWTMIGANSSPRVAGFVTQWCKIARGLGAGVCIAFQEINDAFSLDGGKYGKAVLNACETVLLFGMREQQADETQNILHLTDLEKNLLKQMQRGSAVLCAGNRVPIRIMPSREELMAFTTDNRLLNQKLESIKEKNREVNK